MLEPDKCREHAAEFMKRAAKTIDPIERNRLSEIAYGWHRLAIDLARLEEKLTQRQQDAA